LFIADEEGTLHRIADPPKKKSPPTNSEGIGKAQPPALRRKIATTTTPFYPDVLFIGRVESPPVSDDEPTAPGEEPPQRESRRRRNRRRNIRRHHQAGEQDPEQPVSRDEVSEMGETPEERVFKERRNSRRRDRRRAQEQAEQDARQRRENPLFGRNLNPDFAQAMNTPSEVEGVLARIADGLPRTPDAGGFDACSPKQPTIFYLPLTRRTTCDTPSTVAETRGAPSTLRVNDGMRTRSAAGRNTTGIMASQLGAKPLEPNQRRPRLVELPGDGRGTTTTTPLPGTDIIPDDRRTHAEYPHLLRALGLFSGPQTSRYPTSTSMNLSRIQEAGWPSTPPPLEPPEHLKT
jgi:hypothetical protein